MKADRAVDPLLLAIGTGMKADEPPSAKNERATDSFMMCDVSVGGESLEVSVR